MTRRTGLATFSRAARESGPLWALTLLVDRLSPLGTRRLWKPVRVPVARLTDQIDRILCAWGMPRPHVDITVDKILYADLRGIDSHGCAMLPFYDERRRNGTLNPAPEVVTIRESESTALLDGGGGLGHVPAHIAMGHAMAKARATGIGAVAVRNSGHYGAAGAYAAMAVAEGLIGVATTGTPTPAVVPTFGRQALLGTNPIAVAAPTERNRPFLLDMATSTVSLGKLRDRWRRGRAIPHGWALDERGKPLTNVRAAVAGRRLAPLGGDYDGSSYKGYGLGMAVEILSTVLPGLGVSLGTGSRDRVGHFFVSIDPARFGEHGRFVRDLDLLIDALHDSPPARSDQRVLVPGDPEHATLAQRSAAGIPLTRTVFEDLRGVARTSGVPFVLGEDAP